MKRISLLLLLGVAGCSASPNLFEVQIVGREATGAQLNLCGSKIDLRRLDKRFVATERINCGGEGAIMVSFADAPPVRCPIGYVTPGIEQNFKFVIEGTACRAAPQR